MNYAEHFASGDNTFKKECTDLKQETKTSLHDIEQSTPPTPQVFLDTLQSNNMRAYQKLLGHITDLYLKLKEKGTVFPFPAEEYPTYYLTQNIVPLRYSPSQDEANDGTYIINSDHPIKQITADDDRVCLCMDGEIKEWSAYGQRHDPTIWNDSIFLGYGVMLGNITEDYSDRERE